MSRPALAAFVVALLAPLPAAAQDAAEIARRFESFAAAAEARIAALEAEVASLRGGAVVATRPAVDDRAVAAAVDAALASADVAPANVPGAAAGGISFGVVGDFVFAATDQRASYAKSSRFDGRGLELTASGRVDPSVRYVGVLHFLPDEVEFEEGYAVLDRGLPDTFTLRAGKFRYDFGKLVQMHEHELPFVEAPAVAQEFLGGSPSGLGVELDHWFGLGDVPLRWSIGVADSYSGDTVAFVGPAAAGHEDEEAADGPGGRGLDSFVFHVRAVASIDVGAASLLELGASVLRAPEIAAFADDGLGGTLRVDGDKTTFGFDLAIKWADPAREDAFTFGAEVLRNRERFASFDDSVVPVAASATSPATAWGGYAYAEYAFDRRWSLGVFGDAYEHVEDPSEERYGAGAFVTWRVDAFNRVRIEARAFDDPSTGASSFAALLQWTVTLGAHSHGLQW